MNDVNKGCQSCPLCTEMRSKFKIVKTFKVKYFEIFCFAVKKWVRERFSKDNCLEWGKKPAEL